jgi:ATP-citrate lyase alpha-subunit
MFQKTSKAIIYGRHLDVAQRMLDFDYISGRTPSVAGIVDPGTRRVVYTKVFFGNGEILLPIYPDFVSIPADIHIDTCVNMASFRSAADATWQAIYSEMFAHIVIIAEGIPERDIREIIAFSSEKNICII